MKYLIDVNIALAALIAGHSEHGRAEKWLGGLAVSDEVLLCPLVELGFVRVALLGKYINEMATAKKVIAGFVPGKARLVFVPDASRAKDLPPWVKKAAAVADGHLPNVAEAHGARFATMDEGIPGAWVI